MAQEADTASGQRLIRHDQVYHEVLFAANALFSAWRFVCRQPFQGCASYLKSRTGKRQVIRLNDVPGVTANNEAE